MKKEIKHKDGLTVEGLRHLLFSVADQNAPVHIIEEFKFGKIKSTRPVIGLRFELDGEGKQHIMISTL